MIFLNYVRVAEAEITVKVAVVDGEVNEMRRRSSGRAETWLAPLGYLQRAQVSSEVRQKLPRLLHAKSSPR